jgi:hypothetical protein
MTNPSLHTLDMQARKQHFAKKNNHEEIPHEESKELLLSYVPQATKHIVEFSKTGILKPGNLLTICGHIGLGKSQITESIISSFLHPYVDTLGMRVAVLDRPLLWIDGERTRDDISIGFARIKQRIVLENNPELIEDDRFKNVFCYPLIDYPNIPARRKELERLVLEHDPCLLVLDGAADFVRDVNNTEEATDFIALLIALANQHSFGAIASIHPNPGQNQESKPRGVLGSEMLRKSESVLLLKRAPDNRDIRILTMDFGHGKNRNAADNLEHYFSWSSEHKMFVSCEYTPTMKPKKAEDQESAFNEILEGKRLQYDELVKELLNRGKCKSIPTAKRWISDCTKPERQVIFNNNGTYALSPF